MRPQQDIERTIDRHGNTVWRVCVLYFKQSPDAQDAFQETLLRYSLNENTFNDEEHCKAWLIRVATNVCKDMLKASHRKNLSLNEEPLRSEPFLKDEKADSTAKVQDILEAMYALTDPPRTPLYLALYEGYSVPEISNMLEAPVNTVYSWIARGKKQLREVLS